VGNNSGSNPIDYGLNWGLAFGGNSVSGRRDIAFYNTTTGAGDKGFIFYQRTGAGKDNLGGVTGAGAWTLGPSGANSSIQHTARGRFDTYSNTATTTDGLFTCSSNVGGAGLIKFRVDADGDVTAAGTISDLRAKKLVRNIPYGLNELLQLDPSGFRWNHEEDNAVEWFTPASAQKLQEIMPEMVREDGLGMTDENGQAFVAKAIYKDEILAVTVKAIQELHAELQTLKGA
jgi:hypothetical protein